MQLKLWLVLPVDRVNHQYKIVKCYYQHLVVVHHLLHRLQLLLLHVVELPIVIVVCTCVCGIAFVVV